VDGVSDAKPPYDLRLQYEAAAIDHCLKLGAVVLKPPKTVGFERHAVAPPEPPAPEEPPWR
jgi:hypothetical protein